MALKKIEEMIRKGISPSEVRYHTWRKLSNRKGEIAGELRVLVLKKDGIARVEYVCPYCGEYGYLEKEWKRPFRFKCEHCGKTIRVPKMKEQAKREMKAGK